MTRGSARLRPIAAVLFAALIGGEALAAPWTPLIGVWRKPDLASCGVDDVRYGLLTSVGANSLLVGHVRCVIDEGSASEDGAAITIAGVCDLGGGYMTRLAYEWRLSSNDEAVVRHEGFEMRLIRCERGVE